MAFEVQQSSASRQAEHEGALVKLKALTCIGFVHTKLFQACVCEILDYGAGVMGAILRMNPGIIRPSDDFWVDKVGPCGISGRFARSG